LGFKVDDVKATVEALRKKGVKVALEPFDDRAFIVDPNGIWIELF